MKNTIKNKAKFFAHHYGQIIRFWTANGSDKLLINANFSVHSVSYSSLFLKPLSSITDEDYFDYYESDFFPEIHKKANDEQLRLWGHSDVEIRKIKVDCGKSVMGLYNHNRGEVVDFLRIKGYAVPWMGLSVETLIEYSWIKLMQTSLF